MHVEDFREQRNNFSKEKKRVREGEFYRELIGILRNYNAWDWMGSWVKENKGKTLLLYLWESKGKFICEWILKILRNY